MTDIANETDLGRANGEFRKAFPVFENRKQYPDAQVNFWLMVAYARLRAARWGSLMDAGIQLFVAHNIVLDKRAADAAKRGGDPGIKVGALSGSSVGDVAVSYDVSASTIAGAGHWNQTTYGTRYLELERIVGAGPIQLGVGCVSPLSGMAWSGPPVWPGWLAS